MGKKTRKKSKVKLLHQYYSYTGFYGFIWRSVKKAILPIALFILALYLFNRYVFNINHGLETITETFSRLGVLTTFFISEILLGLVPPEIFIAWTKKTQDPLINLSLIALLSYTGGIIAYYLGKATLRITFVKNYLEVKMAKSLKNVSKWGGFLILVGAVLPLPFSTACFTAGMIKYPIKGVLLFGLFRFLRFAIYGWAIFKVVT